MTWELLWAMIAVATVALGAFGVGFKTGFKDGVIAMREGVERILIEEKEMYADMNANERDSERDRNERKKTP